MAELLRGQNVVVVGDDFGATAAVGKALAEALGYAPLNTPALVEQGAGGEERFGDIAVADAALAEAQVLESLATFVRCVVSTAGGGAYAAARGDCWRFLYAGVTLWVDSEDAAAAGAEAAPQREAYELAEVRVVHAGGALRDEHVGEVAAQALAGLKSFLEADPDVCGKKSLYVRLGCRGDWPDLKPPGWDPENPDVIPKMPGE